MLSICLVPLEEGRADEHDKVDHEHCDDESGCPLLSGRDRDVEG